MRTTFNIPDPLYRELKTYAAAEGLSLRQVVLEAIEMRLAKNTATSIKRMKLPIIRSKRPGTLHLTNEQIDDLTAFC